MDTLRTLLDWWWWDFRKGNPHATAAYQLLSAEEGSVVHDHIALRTFGNTTVNIDALMAPFVAEGYSDKADYIFPKTHVFARHYEHSDATLPKIFISQLDAGQFSKEFQARLHGLLSDIPYAVLGTWEFFETARPWNTSFATYETLHNESEYAAWVAAFGFRPTHFAIQTDSFTRHRNIQALNSFLKDHGFTLNTMGGEIQGSQEVFLEQSSLKAATPAVAFSDGVHTIPSTYYEFARRYFMPNGTRFNGFHAGSAENLFRSAHT